MQRLDRLERVTDLLLVLLDTPRPLSLREIANRVPGYPDTHGARRQAFERDKRLLRDEGVPVLVVPIDGEDQLGYRIDPDSYYLPDLGLEADEQAALNLAVAGVHLGEPIGRDALLKLGAGESRLGSPPVPLVDLRSVDGLPALPVLFDALGQRSAVRFGYRGDQRELDVAGLRFRLGNWYAVGLDRRRSEPRTFRVDRIDGVPELLGPQSARLPDGFDVDDVFGREPWQFGAGEMIDVDVRVDGAVTRRVVAELGADALVGEGSVVEGSDADGVPGADGVVVRLSVTDVDALVLWVLDLVDHAMVLRPQSVRDAVVARLRATVAAGGGSR